MCFGQIFISDKDLKKHRAAARAGRWIQPVKSAAERQENELKRV
jgi:hypothetical protein